MTKFEMELEEETVEKLDWLSNRTGLTRDQMFQLFLLQTIAGNTLDSQLATLRRCRDGSASRE